MEDELLCLINKFKNGDTNAFLSIRAKMTPLIIKYSKILRFCDFEDMKSEFTLVLLESIHNLQFCQSEKQVLFYINRAITNRFHELYRTSTKQLSEVYMDNDNPNLFDFLLNYYPKEFSSILFESDIKSFISSLSESKREIAYCILVEGLSDIETGKRFHKTRQYIHRLRKEFYIKLKELFVDQSVCSTNSRD